MAAFSFWGAFKIYEQNNQSEHMYRYNIYDMIVNTVIHNVEDPSDDYDFLFPIACTIRQHWIASESENLKISSYIYLNLYISFKVLVSLSLLHHHGLILSTSSILPLLTVVIQ